MWKENAETALTLQDVQNFPAAGGDATIPCSNDCRMLPMVHSRLLDLTVAGQVVGRFSEVNRRMRVFATFLFAHFFGVRVIFGFWSRGMLHHNSAKGASRGGFTPLPKPPPPGAGGGRLKVEGLRRGLNAKSKGRLATCLEYQYE